MKPSTAVLEPSRTGADHLEVVPGSLPALRVALTLPLHRPVNRYSKRAFDLFFAWLFLLPFLFLLPLVALLIRIDSKGPVFFRQRRLKRNCAEFFCWKFRTMVVNPEADHRPATGGDPRITRVGRLLRKTHLDELPQLINVLRGDMSLVGPRPYMISDHERYQDLIPAYHLRHEVKPGLTGLAQSSGHFGQLLNAREMNERVELDHRYVRQWTMAMDLRILLRTLLQALRS